MYKLYFSDRIIYIDSDASAYSSSEVLYTAPDDRTIQKANLLQKIQTTKHLALIGPDSEALYDAVIAQFPTIEAGGGLVTNARGEILMIFRHTRWDLPKGKLEPDERIEDCAVREVEEETGILRPERGDRLLVTGHFYRLDGEWTCKMTTWYAMSYAGDAAPVPQVEEDITAIEWVSPAKLDAYLRTSYPTIVDVFEAAGYRIR
jgi:8-oxo-dGTP pyrophosphatase MutT (NUDIX family)